MNSSLIHKNGVRAIGQKELENFRQGNGLTPRETLRAQCYDCTGGFADGRNDCGMNQCPIYPYMPYKGKKFKTT